MSRSLAERRGILLVLFALSLLFLSSSVARAREQMSLHVLFTGNVGGRLEPSG